LARPARTPADVARAMGALHGTDPASVFLSVHARSAAAVTVADIERALYDDRSLLRMLGMRRTVFVVPVELAPVVQAACTDAVAVQLRRTYTRYLTDAGVADGAWLAELEEAALRALAARGQATGAELSSDEPRLRTKFVLNAGKAYEGSPSITTWVLSLLAAEGRVARGRPRGSWLSSQHAWSTMESWLPPDGMPRMGTDQARVDLVRAWLTAFGPGTVADLRWWTGWTAAQVARALTELAPVEVDLDGATGLLLNDDTAAVRAPAPWVALLPALDPTPMGWSERSWYLGAHGPALFDRSGNIGPSVWCDGRIVGGWAQRRDGEVRYRLFEDIGAEAVAAVESAAARVAEWIGPVRVTPRFRTPLERELSA
jgi:hypothetical protein